MQAKALAANDTLSPSAVEFRRWLMWGFGLTLCGIAVRFLLNFSHTYAPATDAAYYPVQTRNWLLHGRFLYNDLPLMFWLDAGLSKALMFLGQPLDEAVMLASRILDCLTEPWVAVFVMALGYSWSGGSRRALRTYIAAALLAVLSPPVIRMLSDFQKNSLGLVWMAAAIWACHRAMLAPGLRRWALLALALLLAALTHIGAFALTFLTVGAAFVLWRPRLAMKFAVAMIPVAALLYYFEPRRARALLQFDELLGQPVPLAPLLLLVPVGFLAAAVVRRWRRNTVPVPNADRAILSALLVIVVILVLPKNIEYFGRLLQMAPLPVSLLLAFLAAGSEKLWPEKLLFWGSIALALASPLAVQGPFMDDESARELRDFKATLDHPESTLVVAPHGHEWWAGFMLGTPVRNAMPDDAFSRYSRVLLLRPTGRFLAPGMMRPGDPGSVRISGEKIYNGRNVQIYEAAATKAQGTGARAPDLNTP